MENFSTFVDQIETPLLIDLANYWLSIKANHSIPFRQHFNPTEIPQCLRHIILFDVLDSNPRFCIRLVGSAINPAFTGSANGQYIENILSEQDLAEVLPQYEYTVTHKIPTHKKGTVTVPAGKQLNYERIILPLTTDGENVDKLLTGLNFFDIRMNIMDRPILKI